MGVMSIFATPSYSWFIFFVGDSGGELKFSANEE